MKTTGPSGPADWTSVSRLLTRVLRPSAVRKRAPVEVRSMTYVMAARRSRNAASLSMFLPPRLCTLVPSGHAQIVHYPRACGLRGCYNGAFRYYPGRGDGDAKEPVREGDR